MGVTGTAFEPSDSNCFDTRFQGRSSRSLTGSRGVLPPTSFIEALRSDHRLMSGARLPHPLVGASNHHFYSTSIIFHRNGSEYPLFINELVWRLEIILRGDTEIDLYQNAVSSPGTSTRTLRTPEIKRKSIQI